MRLTLRTLLAHLDGVPVDGGDSEEFAKKIDESDFVRNLVQRIRNLVARPRLPAPKVDGPGLGHDANTVAAYLDNTLPQDRTPDFEKVCLESDVLLSEVAACHQILSRVLQNPAKVSPRLRERVYRIGDLGTAAGAASKETPTPPPVATPPPADAVEPKPAPRKREIPEYLRAPRSLGWKPLALTVALGFLLAAIILRAMGPFDANHPVLGFLAGDPEVAVNIGDKPLPSDSAPATPGPDRKADAPAAGAGSATPESAPPKDDAGATESDSVEAAGENAAPADDVSPAPVRPAPKAGEAPAAPDADLPPGIAEVDPGAEKPAGDEPPAEDGSSKGVASARSPTTEDPIPPSIIASVAPPDEAPKPAAAPSELGAFISEDEVLARFDRDTNSWLRTPPNAPLMAGEQLLALPAYRPKMALASGVQMTLGGGTLVELRPSSGLAHVAIDYGRVVFVPIGAAGASMQLDLWGRQGEVTFTEGSSLMAVQVRRYRSPGIDPEAGLAHRMVEIHAVRGGLVWREPDHPEQPINAGESFACLDDARGRANPTDQIPAWVENKDIERSDALAAREMETMLPTERPLSLSLLELTEHRKSEIRALAVRCLTYLNLFEPFVDALRDDLQKSYRDDHFNEVQRALARSPETAVEVRVALEKVRGRPAGQQLYRLLWSYSPDDLASGAADDLVGYLEHADLDFRVLAIENLNRITGMTMLYFPEVSEVRRRAATNRWREKLRDDEIKYTENVLLLPPRLAEE